MHRKRNHFEILYNNWLNCGVIYFLKTCGLGHHTGHRWEFQCNSIAFGQHCGTICNVFESRLDIVSRRFNDWFSFVQFVAQTLARLIFGRIECVAECETILLIANSNVRQRDQSVDIVQLCSHRSRMKSNNKIYVGKKMYRKCCHLQIDTKLSSGLHRTIPSLPMYLWQSSESHSSFATVLMLIQLEGFRHGLNGWPTAVVHVQHSVVEFQPISMPDYHQNRHTKAVKHNTIEIKIENQIG